MIRYFSKHPTAANILMLSLVIIGLTSLPSLKRETFPDFAANKVEVRIVYPGASPEEVEEAICQRVQDAIDGTSHIKEMSCESRDSLAIAVIEWDETGEFAELVDDIRINMDAIDSFPTEVEDPVIQVLARTDPVAFIAITGPMNVTDLKAYAEELKRKLLRLPSISLVEVQGFSDRQIRIEVPNHWLQQYGLSLQDVARTIEQQSTNLPAGSLLTRDQDVLLRFDDGRTTPTEFSELTVISKTSGAEIRLGDIARITDRFEADEVKVMFNGERAALLNIEKTRAEDVIEVGQVIRNFIKEEQATAPPGVKLHLTNESFSLVEDRLSLLLTNSWQGLILVLLTLALFFNLRFAFWVAMGLPVSFLATLFVMQGIGYSINMLTMVALLMAIGLLVDDAIVISENIASELSRGKTALEAAIAGTDGVKAGVFSSFLTTVCIFGPLAFLEGNIGKVLLVIPVVLIVTLSVSLIEAFLILPHHLKHAMAHSTQRSRFRELFEAGLDRFRNRVILRLVTIIVEWRYVFVGSVLAVLLMSLSLVTGGSLQFRAFPNLEGNNIEARLLLPPGSPLSLTEQKIDHIVAALERMDAARSSEQPEGQSLIRNIRIQTNQNADANETGPHVATVAVDLLPAEERVGRLDDLLQHWRDEVGVMTDIVQLNITELGVGPAGLPIDIRIQGSDLDTLKTVSLAMQAELATFPGVISVFDDLRPGKLEVRLRLREGALALGLDAQTIANQLRSAFFGVTVDEIQLGVESYEIDVRLASQDRNSLDDLDDFLVRTPGGLQVPLSQVAEARWERGLSRIFRVDGERTVTIRGEVDTSVLNVNVMTQKLQAEFLPSLLAQYPDVTINFKGEVEEGGKTQQSMARLFLLGLVGVFFLLSFQFRSYREPIAVMFVIPLGLIGVFWGHWLMGLDVTMPSMVGFASLAGVVVNDSILLVTFLKNHIQQGMTVHEAAALASRDRFRAILLTSLSTIAGMTPLLFETSLQAQVLIPLVTSLVFGILAATLAVLFLIPALYSIFDDLGWVQPIASQE